MKVCIVSASGKLGRYMIGHALAGQDLYSPFFRFFERLFRWLGRLVRQVHLDDQVEACRRIVGARGAGDRRPRIGVRDRSCAVFRLGAFGLLVVAILDALVA